MRKQDRKATSALDVANLAGVSRAAVSRCFTPGASIAPETRAKVIQAAQELGYEVNRLASGLIRNETGLVALIAAEIDTPYRSSLLAALTAQLQLAGKLAILINTNRSDESVTQALRKAISYRVDAAIFLSGMPAPALAETCARSGMRLVLINRDEVLPGSLRILLDDTEAGRLAFRLLVTAGCRRPALASSLAATTSLIARETGFREAANEAGFELRVARAGATSYATGLDLGTELLAGNDRPDGIFCTTDLLALGLMDAARWRLGLRIPQALSVIGFDDIAQASWESYALATFAQPIDKIARATVDWLSAADRNDDSQECRIAARFLARDSLARHQPDG